MKDNGTDDTFLLTPTGSGGRKVRRGETLSRIAQGTGHLAKTIRNEQGNSAVFGSRTSPEILLPGDQLTIPPIRSKEVDAGTCCRHTFRRLVGESPKLQLVFSLNGVPRSEAAYTLDLGGGKKLTGTTDSQGVLEQNLPVHATRGTIRFEGEDEPYKVEFGELDPLKTIRGVSQRLANLGYSCEPGESGPELSRGLRAAIRAFREDSKETPASPKGPKESNDRLDQELFDKLEAKHGS